MDFVVYWVGNTTRLSSLCGSHCKGAQSAHLFSSDCGTTLFEKLSPPSFDDTNNIKKMSTLQRSNRAKERDTNLFRMVLGIRAAAVAADPLHVFAQVRSIANEIWMLKGPLHPCSTDFLEPIHS